MQQTKRKRPPQSLLVMPPPQTGSEWLAEYCAGWSSLLDAQERVLAAQTQLLAAQRKLLAGLSVKQNRKTRAV